MEGEKEKRKASASSGVVQEEKLRIQLNNLHRQIVESQLKYTSLCGEYEKLTGNKFEPSDEQHKKRSHAALTSRYEPEEQTAGWAVNVVEDNETNCKVCKKPSTSPNFSVNKRRCERCRVSKPRITESPKCKAPPQVWDNHEIDWRIPGNCLRCRLFKIRKCWTTEGNQKFQLVDSIPPNCTTEGGFAFFQDLAIIEFDYSLIRPTDADPLHETAAMIVYGIDFESKSTRVMASFLLKVELNDPRIRNAFGLQQLLSNDRSHAHLQQLQNHDLKLVAVDLKLIPWSWEPEKWTPIAAEHISTLNLCHLLTVPVLNSVPQQGIQTTFLNLCMEREYLDFDKLKTLMLERGAKIDWITSDLKGTKLKEPEGNEYGVIYMYCFESGYVDVGQSSGKIPTNHNPSTPTCKSGCEVCEYMKKNSKDNFFKTVLKYVQKKGNDDQSFKETLFVYEGHFQIMFLLAQFFGSKLSSLKIPFPPSTEKKAAQTTFKKNWLKLDLNNLPEVPIKLLNRSIHGRSYTSDQWKYFVNIPLVLFGTKLDITYEDWATEPLRYIHRDIDFAD